MAPGALLTAGSGAAGGGGAASAACVTRREGGALLLRRRAAVVEVSCSSLLMQSIEGQRRHRTLHHRAPCTRSQVAGDACWQQQGAPGDYETGRPGCHQAAHAGPARRGERGRLAGRRSCRAPPWLWRPGPLSARPLQSRAARASVTPPAIFLMHQVNLDRERGRDLHQTSRHVRFYGNPGTGVAWRAQWVAGVSIEVSSTREPATQRAGAPGGDRRLTGILMPTQLLCQVTPALRGRRPVQARPPWHACTASCSRS